MKKNRSTQRKIKSQLFCLPSKCEMENIILWLLYCLLNLLEIFEYYCLKWEKCNAKCPKIIIIIINFEERFLHLHDMYVNWPEHILSPAFLGNDLQEPSPLAWMYLTRISSSAAVHLPFFNPTFSQHGALPITGSRPETVDAQTKQRKQNRSLLPQLPPTAAAPPTRKTHKPTNQSFSFYWCSLFANNWKPFTNNLFRHMYIHTYVHRDWAFIEKRRTRDSSGSCGAGRSSARSCGGWAATTPPFL